MAGQQVASRFGQDSYPRIATSTPMLTEAGEVIPFEPMYQPLVPFLPPEITTGGGGVELEATTEDGHKLWQLTPAPCDLVFYQGDDVVIPLYFNDPALSGDDMAATFEWFAQIRVIHSYRSALVNDFVCKAVYHPSTGTPPVETDEYTMVELFLPRSENCYSGYFRWELYSISTEDYSRFPKPDDVAPEDWPPPDALRTWLYGRCTIVPRTTTTDFLPTPPSTNGSVPVLGQGGWFVGPNGRVP